MRKLWNNTKTAMLMAGLMGLCMGVGYLLGGRGFMLPALGIGAIMNLAALFFSDKLALLTMRAQPVGPEDDPALYNMVRDLSQKAGLPMPRVYISPAQAPNAFATGRSPSHSVVCVTEGLRRILTERELAGVISHELSHIRNRDMLIGTMAAIVAGAISYLAYWAMWAGSDDDRNPLVAILVMLLAPLAAGLIQMAISRSREYEADRSGATLMGDPQALASALAKLESVSSQVPLPVNPAESHLFIVQPLTGKKVASLFATHPPIEERIRRLMEMQQR